MNGIINKQSLWLRLATEIQAISQTGISYTKDAYDRERYERLVYISAQMMAQISDAEEHELHQTFLQQKGYACPKLDIRAFILKDNQVCLVKEAQDGKWSLPGGWADVNQTPSQCAVREVFEETGFNVEADYLMAYWDTACHEHPKHWPYIYKAVFCCHLKGGMKQISHEIEDVKFFPFDQLPVLSEYRITEKQILQLYNLYKSGNKLTVFD